MRTVRDALVGSFLLALVMTFGDFVWSAMNLPHRVAYGIAHGAVMCGCLGLVIGWRAGRVVAGAIAGPLIGVIAALTFYALASTMGYIAMVPAWMLFWILFAVLQTRLAKAGTAHRTALRGFAAAILSGIAFYLISGIWMKPGPPDYAVNLAAWTIAFLPGFCVLFMPAPRR
ncbi:MAG: hypothetical protein ABIS06_22305 [Vicinamibacterales bacterium]